MILSFWVEIIAGAFLLFGLSDERWFLLYFMVIVLFTIARHIDYTRKLVRMFQIFNEIKFLSMIRKLKITDDEISIVAESEKNKMGELKWAELEKEFAELTKNN